LKIKLAKHLTNTCQALILQAADTGKLPAPPKLTGSETTRLEAAKGNGFKGSTAGRKGRTGRERQNT
jgi:hypothetical protein